MHPLHSDWLVPEWPAPGAVKALFSSRQGGISGVPYDSLNLGLHVGDDALHVQHNRHVLQAAVGVRPVYLQQVHGWDVLPARADSPDGVVADAACTSEPGLACCVMVADCLPVLFCDAEGRQVAAAHAGWRGLLGSQGHGVLEASVARYAEPRGLLAWLGPCIGPAAFEVGEEVRSAFVADTPEARAFFLPKGEGKWLADLPALARQRLQRAGVQAIYGNDGSQAWCTVANASRFFSHRRDRISGRMAACIWLTG